MLEGEDGVGGVCGRICADEIDVGGFAVVGEELSDAAGDVVTPIAALGYWTFSVHGI